MTTKIEKIKLFLFVARKITFLLTLLYFHIAIPYNISIYIFGNGAYSLFFHMWLVIVVFIYLKAIKEYEKQIKEKGNKNEA